MQNTHADVGLFLLLMVVQLDVKEAETSSSFHGDETTEPERVLGGLD